MHIRKSKKEYVIPVSEQKIKCIIDESHIEDTFQNRQQIISVLSRLDEASAQLIELRFFDEYSFKEIGEITGMSADNAKVKTYRALEKIKQMLLFK